jgi:hypothetical protein
MVAQEDLAAAASIRVAFTAKQVYDVALRFPISEYPLGQDSTGTALSVAATSSI